MRRHDVLRRELRHHARDVAVHGDVTAVRAGLAARLRAIPPPAPRAVPPPRHQRHSHAAPHEFARQARTDSGRSAGDQHHRFAGHHSHARFRSRIMPDMLRTLGILFLALIAAAGVGLGFWYHQDQQARQFVTTVTPLIYKTWNVEALTHRSASVLRTPDYEAQVRDHVRDLQPAPRAARFGHSSRGQLRFGRADRELPRGLYGQYTSTAKFRDARGEARIPVIKEQGAWRIASLQVGSPGRILQSMSKQQRRGWRSKPG